MAEVKSSKISEQRIKNSLPRRKKRRREAEKKEKNQTSNMDRRTPPIISGECLSKEMMMMMIMSMGKSHMEKSSLYLALPYSGDYRRGCHRHTEQNCGFLGFLSLISLPVSNASRSSCVTRCHS